MRDYLRMLVSVILCTYGPDSIDDFEECAASIFDQTYDPIELVVVVDGDEDRYWEIKARYGDREDVTIHLNDENRGLLASRNTGAELSTGDIVAFIDVDATADERWIQELVNSYNDRDALAVGGKMVANWVARKPGFLPEEFYWLIGVTHRGFPESAGEVRNTFGSNISFRRDVFLELDGFDTTIGGRKGERNLQGGETELCTRLRNRSGRGVYYNPNAVVAHKIFDYRTRLGWLLNRAFWQGYSKRRMVEFVEANGDEEGRFFSLLLTEFIPRRIWGLLRSPSLNAVSQLGTLAALTAAVGAGYAYALVRP